MARIMIVEDEVAIAEDLQDILEIAGHEVVDTAYSYDQAITALAAREIDCCFLDIALRGRGSGLDIADVINKKYHIPFIFLTSFSDVDTMQEVVSKNPGGYLVKPFKEKDIAPAIALALANAQQKKQELFPSIEYINQYLDYGLSSQEYRVLKLIWQGNKNQDIANELFVSINTIKTHLSNVYAKLEVNSRASAINKALKL